MCNVYIYIKYIYVCILCPQILWMISQYCSTVNEQHVIKRDKNSSESAMTSYRFDFIQNKRFFCL